MNHFSRHLAGPLIVFLLLLTGCSGPSASPVDQIRRQMPSGIDYSIILEDMKQEGVFVKEGFHRYRVVTPEGGSVTEWMAVTPKFYERNIGNLGMTLYSKVGKEETESAAPPGYAYVGDPRYGQWQERSDGTSFWEFYGKFALLQSLFGGWYSPIGYRDYGMFHNYRNRRPFYGSSNQYGTRSGRSHTSRFHSTGNRSRSTNGFTRNFNQKTQTRKSSFTSRVKQRVGRTRVTSRGRGGGFGK